MKKLSIFCILLFSILAMNCGKSYPKCADKDSIDLVKQIVGDNKCCGDYEEKFKNSIQLERIMTTRIDEKIGFSECSAKVSYTRYWDDSDKDSYSKNITYKVQIAEESGRLFGTVWGLN